MRKVCYVTGTRADFGLMHSTLQQISQDSALELSVLATGMHLDPAYGCTIKEVEQAGFRVLRVESPIDDGTRMSMVNSVASQMNGFARAFSDLNPDVVLLLGDRGEMLAAATAALYLNIPVAHIHGGERSGTVDESIRHAISKLSHFHFVSTESAGERLVRMGEEPSKVFVTGAPGLDDIMACKLEDKAQFIQRMEFDPEKQVLAMVFHPVVQKAEEAGSQMLCLLEALPLETQGVILLPNSDAGGHQIRDVIESYDFGDKDFRVVKHLPRLEYLSLIANCGVLIGNSSSGIIEAASFETPVINVGERQANRERNKNVFDLDVDTEQVRQTIEYLLSSNLDFPSNIYGDGKAGDAICKLLTEIQIDEQTTSKCNAY